MKSTSGHMATIELIESSDKSLLVRKKVCCKEFLQNHLFVMRKLRSTDVVPKLAKYSIRELYLEYGYIKGQHLQKIPTRYHEECFYTCGVSLALFHQKIMSGYGPVYAIREKNVEWWLLQDNNLKELSDYCCQFKLLDKAIVTKLVKVYFYHRKNVDEEYSSCLTHRDYRLDNLLFIKQDGDWKCRVLDFDHVMAGPAHLDFGRIEQDIFDNWTKSKQNFLEGYKSIKELPNLHKVLPLYRILWPLKHIVWGIKNGALSLVNYNQQKLYRIYSSKSDSQAKMGSLAKMKGSDYYD